MKNILIEFILLIGFEFIDSCFRNQRFAASRFMGFGLLSLGLFRLIGSRVMVLKIWSPVTGCHICTTLMTTKIHLFLKFYYKGEIEKTF